MALPLGEERSAFQVAAPEVRLNLKSEARMAPLALLRSFSRLVEVCGQEWRAMRGFSKMRTLRYQ